MMQYDYINLFPLPKKEDRKILDECWRRLVKEAKDHPMEIKLIRLPERKDGKNGKA